MLQLTNRRDWIFPGGTPQPGTRLWLKADGEGTYERWQSSRFGPNRHYIRLASGGTTKKVALKNLNDEIAALSKNIEVAKKGQADADAA